MTMQNNNFELDNRSLLTRLIAFQAYCKTIPFGNTGACWDQVFFNGEYTPQSLAARFTAPEDVRNLPPQLTFLLAFMQMMETPRRLLNSLPERHRQLYYRGELGVSELAAQPDTALVTFRPEAEQAELYLPNGMMLTGGQDSNGVPRLYSLQQTVSVNHTRWCDLRWLRAAVDKNDSPVCRVLLDESQKISFPAGGVRLFSSEQQSDIALHQGRLVVSSLLLSAGEQRVVKVTYASSLPGGADLLLQVSTKEGWGTLQATEDNSYIIPDEIIPAAPAGLAGYSFAFPVLRILNRQNDTVPEVSSLTVMVRNMAGIQMRTDSGMSDVGQSSAPFGSEPLLGDGFQLMSEQWCNQNADFILTVTPEWQGLPEDFRAWYAGYDDGTVENGDFKASIVPVAGNPAQPFFDQTANGTIPVKPIVVHFPSPRLSIADEQAFWRHAPRITLSGKDFLHRIYRQMVAKGTPPPNLPYDPRFRAVTINAEATGVPAEQYVLTPFGYQKEALNGNEAGLSTLYMGFSDITPGQQLTLYWDLKAPRQINAEGLRWYYLAESEGGEGIWQLLQQELDDQTESLFKAGLWSTVLPQNATAVSTLMPAGRYWLRVQGFELAEQKKRNSPQTPEQPQPQVEHYPWLYALYPNAGTAILANVSSIETDRFKPLPAGSINGTEVLFEGLAEVNQPLPSWGGSAKENEADFIQRVAMRLVHRERASSWRDISALLLARFPEVHHIRLPGVENLDGLYQPEPDEGGGRKTRSLNRKPANESSEDDSHIQKLMIVPRVGHEYRDNDDPLRPMLNPARLVAMERYIMSQASPWLQLQVLNPEYFVVKVEYSVEWQTGANIEQCKLLLQETLRQHFMPWRNEQSTVELGNSLSAYDVMSVIQHQPYVNYVRDVWLNGQRDPVNTTLKVIIIEPVYSTVPNPSLTPVEC
ncbi:hypothetical protein SME10J_23790 [Serratia marcescens]|nr:hypothetical protein SME10J_23790 [Serratia marcescens]